MENGYKMPCLAAAKVPGVFYATRTVEVDGIIVSKNQLVFKDDDGTVYIQAERLHRFYEGANPYMLVYVYDDDFGCWSDPVQLRNRATRAIWKAWCLGGKKRERRDDVIPKNKPIRKHKHGSGFYKDRVNAITDQDVAAPIDYYRGCSMDHVGSYAMAPAYSRHGRFTSR